MKPAFDLGVTEVALRGAPGEYTDRTGAEKLKSMIEAYWRERGYDLTVNLVPAAFTPALRASRYDVRSDLTNGLPPTCCKNAKEEAEE